MKRVAILGLGLMGGSLGLAIKSRRLPWQVAGYTRTPERGRQAVRRGAVDVLLKHPSEAVAGADLVVVCAPILVVPQLVRECRGHLARGAVVTDVGSTKAFLEAEVPALLRETGAAFVGSHPMAGSEKQGIEAARPDLYEGAVVLVSPPRAAPARALQLVRGFWRRLGARPETMDAREHDRVVARTSHLPHMVASLLVLTAARAGRREQVGAFCGPGFADTTRVAEGSPDVWEDIVRTNRANVAEELRSYRLQMDKLIELLDNGDFEGIRHMLENGQAARRTMLRIRRKGSE